MEEFASFCRIIESYKGEYIVKNKELEKMYELARQTLGLKVQFSYEYDIYDLILEMKKLIMNNVIENKQVAREKYIVLCGVKGSISNLKLIVKDKINELEYANKLGNNPLISAIISIISSIIIATIISPIDDIFAKMLMGIFLFIIMLVITYLFSIINFKYNNTEYTKIRYYRLLLDILEDLK